jgi:hypothetical protein
MIKRQYAKKLRRQNVLKQKNFMHVDLFIRGFIIAST